METGMRAKCDKYKIFRRKINFRESAHAAITLNSKGFILYQGKNFPLQNVSIFFTSLPIAKRKVTLRNIRHLGFASDTCSDFRKKVDKK